MYLAINILVVDGSETAAPCFFINTSSAFRMSLAYNYRYNFEYLAEFHHQTSLIGGVASRRIVGISFTVAYERYNYLWAWVDLPVPSLAP